MRRVILLLILAIIPVAALAQMPVEVVNTGSDSVGQRLVYFLKEGIRKSSSMTLTLDDRSRMQVHFASLDPDSRSPGRASAYSVVVAWKNPQQHIPLFLSHFVGYCGGAGVRECADSMVANISEQSELVTQLVKPVPK